MKKKQLITIGTILAISTTSFGGTYAYAINYTANAETVSQNKVNPYYDILQSLGEEYQIEMGLGMPEEMEINDNKLRSQRSFATYEQFTPEEFESLVRNELEKLAEHNQMIVDKYEENGSNIKDAKWIQIDDDTTSVIPMS